MISKRCPAQFQIQKSLDLLEVNKNVEEAEYHL